MQELFQTYLSALQSTSLDQITEHSHRKTLQDLFEGLKGNDDIQIIHEPTKQLSYGRPDFLVKNSKSASIIGYVENKKIDEDISKTVDSEQIAKYLKLSQNILITNYIDRTRIHNGSVQSATLCSKLELKSPKPKLDQEKIAQVNQIISGFFSIPPKGIGSIKSLALELGRRADLLEDDLRPLFLSQIDTNSGDELLDLYKLFRESIDHQLNPQKFIDIFVQTLTYGLFLAKYHHQNDIIDLTNAKKYISSSFSLIKYLVTFLDTLDGQIYSDVKWIIDEIMSILNNADWKGITESLLFEAGQSKSTNLFEQGYVIKDPYVHFYEDFLSVYDPTIRDLTGSYYTPLPVVDYIIKSTEYILQKNFGISKGFADREKVTVLDFATGTGTFLYEIIKYTLRNFSKKFGASMLPEFIQKHILTNFYGLELMMAPYTIAHLKISGLIEQEFAYKLKESERLQIYLSNTLDDTHIQGQNSLQFSQKLSDETTKANEIKTKPILVITGNPPYSGISQNPGLMEDDIHGVGVYKYVDGKHFGERKHWLNDDYVKFIRLAESKMEAVEQGVIAIITNHSFIDNPTFRGMRQHLMNTFDSIYILDLHGNSLKKEKSPDGSVDTNVFDIQQGVAISFFVKGVKKNKGVFISDLFGSRENKYNYLMQNTIETTERKNIIPFADKYIWKDIIEDEEYSKGVKINEMFDKSVTGIVTSRDSLVIGFNNEEIKKNLTQFADMSKTDEQIKNTFSIGDNYQWKMETHRPKLRSWLENNKIQDNLKTITYRPFDERKIFYQNDLVFRTRNEVMQNMFYENIALCIGRQFAVTGTDEFDIILISKNIVDFNLYRRGGELVFPLFLYTPDGSSRKLNIKSDYLDIVREKYGLLGITKNGWTPEENLGYQLLCYLYATLHSPSYRTKYKDFLKSDFPHIQRVDKKRYSELVFLGDKLIKLHLMEEVNGDDIALSDGDNKIEKIKREDNKLYINKTQYISSISEEIYKFMIGGYAVLDKYLKSRKGRQLNLDELEQIGKIVEVVRETIEVMKEIG